MGFFKPGKSVNYYIGIWYKKVSVQTVVWVANRDAPISDPSSTKLTLFVDGNLVLVHNSTSNSLNTTQVVLGDDGNLVLRDGSNPNVVYWQSFDFPTDTWLPGGKFGFNNKTNQSQKLVSWRSEEDPAMGFYKLWDEESNTFLLVPEMRLNYNVNYTYISNVNESYFTYSLYNNSIMSRFVVDVSGQIKQLIWSERTKKWNLDWVQPEQSCRVYGICGPFGSCNQDSQKCECLPGFVPRSSADWSLQDTNGGCVRKTPLQCGTEDGFSPIPSSELPDKPRSSKIDSAEKCRSACEATCSCNGYVFDYRCQLWDGDIMNFNNITSSRASAVFFLRGAAGEFSSLVPVFTSEGK
ncbi:hypothetical protein MKW98_015889 [Papaver atlanticum]|uniref:Uncharacterized protein n=1 Tax=Papaver atlanticum TaxID=357466 RepID=A0AAD4SS86_9MAGN|nr:hypothetical protein MKW98_015889 [Papaver atlanticum]